MNQPVKAAWLLLVALFFTTANRARADGYWSITQLPFQNVLEPAINNTGEIVWFLNSEGGIYSNTRGQLASSGMYPHLANSGEVVYVDRFDTGIYDLTSTTRGRLTFGGTIDVDSAFDVNSSGEVVYLKMDSAGYQQVFSSTRGQITFDSECHYGACINDNGEIVWGQYLGAVGSSRIVSTIRGVLPESYGFDPRDLNNLGDLVSHGNLQSGINTYTFPHIFSSAHGPLIDNPDLNQFGGAINDAGTILWYAQVTPGSSTWSVYEGQWVVPEPSALVICLLGGLAMLGYRRTRFASAKRRLATQAAQPRTRPMKKSAPAALATRRRFKCSSMPTR